jgi:ribosomal protein L11
MEFAKHLNRPTDHNARSVVLRVLLTEAENREVNESTGPPMSSLVVTAMDFSTHTSSFRVGSAAATSGHHLQDMQEAKAISLLQLEGRDHWHRVRD